MDNFDPYEFDSGVTYTAKTGEEREVTLDQAFPARAASIEAEGITSYSDGSDSADRSQSAVATIISGLVAIILLAVGISSFL